MTIDGVGGGANPKAQKPAASEGGNTAQLEQQKKALQDEMKRVKEDGKLKPLEKKKKIETLSKKLKEIEEAIQKAAADAAKFVQSENSSASKKVKELSNPDSSKGFLQNSKTKENSEQTRKKKLGDAGYLLDTYA